MTPNLKHLEKLQALTKEYARFSRSQAGLAYVFLAVLLPITNFISRQLPQSLLGAILSGLFTTCAVLLWLWVRQITLLRFYQTFGTARAALPLLQKDFLLGFIIGFGALTGIIQFIQAFQEVKTPNTFILTIPALLVAGLAAFRELKISGVTVAFATLLIGAFIGGSLNSSPDNPIAFNQTMFFIVTTCTSVGLMILGIYQHQQFKTLEQKFKNLGSP